MAIDVLRSEAGPVLVVDRSRAARNIERMAAKARASGVRFRPHFKTHQSAAVGDLFRAAGVGQITVASLEMARYFADHGWSDITIAFPINPRELDDLVELASRLHLELIVDSVEAARLLALRRFRSSVWIDVDVGYNRTGVRAEDRRGLAAIASVLVDEPAIRLRGLLTHAGHTYSAASPDAVREIYRDSVRKMQDAQKSLTMTTGSALEVSVGDTPSCSLVDRFDGVDEVRPGNFVFYDLQQLQIGSCREDDLALAVACPIVGIYPERAEIVVHGGAVHLSKESMRTAAGKLIYGRVAEPNADGWRLLGADLFVSSLSQEHGVIQVPPTLLSRYRIGELLLVVPVHACLAVSALRRYAYDRRVELRSEVLI